MRIPPLIMLAGALALSAAVATVDPLAQPSPGLRVLGGILGAAGLAVAVAGVVAFRRLRTTVDPRFPERASALVAHGVYRWTRNPMYAGFAGVALGAAAALGSALALVGPGLLIAYLDRLQIPAEERALRARFGAAFDAYARTVGRWIGHSARGTGVRRTSPFVLDSSWQVDPTLIQQRYPDITLPAGTTLRVAEVTAGVYRAAVHGSDGRQVVDHVATDDTEAVHEAVALAVALMPLAPAARWRYLRQRRRRAAPDTPWPSRKRDRWLGVGIGLLVGALLARLLWW